MVLVSSLAYYQQRVSLSGGTVEFLSPLPLLPTAAQQPQNTLSRESESLLASVSLLHVCELRLLSFLFGCQVLLFEG